MHVGQTILFFEVRTDKTLEFYALNKKQKKVCILTISKE